MSELGKSSTASGLDDRGRWPVGRLALGLTVVSTLLYFVASQGVANYFRWLTHAAGRVGH